jgi:hypothetical protein
MDFRSLIFISFRIRILILVHGCAWRCRIFRGTVLEIDRVLVGSCFSVLSCSRFSSEKIKMQIFWHLEKRSSYLKYSKFIHYIRKLRSFVIFLLTVLKFFEMEFFKFLQCAWVYSFRVVYAVLGYACVTPKKTQKDRDYPLTSGTNPLISYILLTIFFWRQMSCLHYADVLKVG